METTTSPEHRLESRNNIFVMATLYAAGGSSPVRIRNMSRSGALVEAGGLPPMGTRIRLSRGSLQVSGNVMWVDEGRAGLHFSNLIRVTDWLPQGNRGTGQQLIDEMVYRSRLETAANPPTADTSDQTAFLFADELNQLRDMLERVGDELASDSSVMIRHSEALQMIDGVAQRLAKLTASAAITAASAKFTA